MAALHPEAHHCNCACGRLVFVNDAPPPEPVFPEAWCQTCIDDYTAPYSERIRRELEIAAAVRGE